MGLGEQKRILTVRDTLKRAVPIVAGIIRNGTVNNHKHQHKQLQQLHCSQRLLAVSPTNPHNRHMDTNYKRAPRSPSEYQRSRSPVIVRSLPHDATNAMADRCGWRRQGLGLSVTGRVLCTSLLYAPQSSTRVLLPVQATNRLRHRGLSPGSLGSLVARKK